MHKGKRKCVEKDGKKLYTDIKRSHLQRLIGKGRGSMPNGIFISYRRDTGSMMARMLYDRLRLEKQYQCFLDVGKLNAGNFRENIITEMDKCDVFLLVLSRNALDRCSNPEDNVRQEIVAALERKLAFIPVTAEDFIWPEKMPEGLEDIKNYNAIPYVQVYSEQFFERLYSFIDKVRGEDAAQHTLAGQTAAAAGEQAGSGYVNAESGKVKDTGAQRGTAGAQQRGKASAPNTSGGTAAGKASAENSGNGNGRGGSSRKIPVPMLIAAAVLMVLLIVFVPKLLKRGDSGKEDPEGADKTSSQAVSTEAAPSAETSSEADTENTETEETAQKEAQVLPESFLQDMVTLSEKRMKNILVENADLSFSTGETNVDVNTRYVSIGNAALMQDALFFETGGTSGFYMAYKAPVAIDEAWEAFAYLDIPKEYPDAVIVLTLDTFPVKFYSVEKGGEPVYKSSDLKIIKVYASEDEYLRNIYGQYQYVTHDSYEIILPKGSEDFAPDASAPEGDSKTAFGPAMDVEPGTDQLNAVLIPLNTKITGTKAEGREAVYYSFRTGEDTAYVLSVVNKTTEVYLRVMICDENGGELEGVYAGGEGSAASKDLTLEPDHTYTLKICCNGNNKSGYYPKGTENDFAIVIKDPENTAVTFWSTSEDTASGGAAVPGTNQDDAARVSVNTDLSGTASNGYVWYYSFRTDEQADAEYVFKGVNKSGQKYLHAVLCDEAGEDIGSLSASSSGELDSFSAVLKAGTVYYLKVYCNGDKTGFYPKDTPIDYTVRIEKAK